MIDLNSAQIWWLLGVATIPAAILSGYRLWVIDRRERVMRLRLEEFRGPTTIDMPTRIMPWYHELGNLLAPIVGVSDQQRLQKLLIAAGIKGQGSLPRFIVMKLLTAISLAFLAWVVIEARNLSVGVQIVTVIAVLMLGWRSPDLILGHLVRRRRSRLEHGMPDAIDLLVICAEAGLSLNQSIEEVSQQLRLANKDVADELATTSAEMRVLPDFGLTLDNLVERTGLEQLRSMIATLKQSIKYGTPLAESLRTIASEIRAERHTRMEERAARLPVLLAIPMMAFILPTLLMIIGTPVVLRMIDTSRNITFGG